jgi:hypothetical protein
MNNRGDFSMAMQSKLRVCGRSLAGIAGSNLAGFIDVCFVSVVCCQVEVSASGPITRVDEFYSAFET